MNKKKALEVLINRGQVVQPSQAAESKRQKNYYSE
jgi:hypothetical protein